MNFSFESPLDLSAVINCSPSHHYYESRTSTQYHLPSPFGHLYITDIPNLSSDLLCFSVRYVIVILP